MGDAELIVRSPFDLYLKDDMLIYVRERCSTVAGGAVGTRSRRRAHAAGQPAVDDQGCARNVLRIVRGEEEGCLCYVP